MKKLIVYAHPWDGSFNHSILNRLVSKFTEKGDSVDVIDLNKDGFDPVLNTNDLKLFSSGSYNDKLAENYAKRLLASDELIFIFPIWWYGEPAILKGFYDKVFLKGHLYDEIDHQLTGLLKVKKATIITTANINRSIFQYLGDPIQNVLAKGILKTVGIDNVDWIHCATVHEEKSRKQFIEEIDAKFN